MCLTAKPCDSCKSVPATVFCRADSAFLCPRCDAEHERHPRVSVCEVCEQAPAAVTCKADDAALCPACDADIHSANPLARRHERFPVAPFYHAEEEAASWLLADPNSKEFLDPDLDLVPGEKKEVGYSSADGVVPVETDREYDVDVYPPSKPLMYNFTSQSITPGPSVSSSSLEVGVVPEHNAKVEAVPARVSGMEREARVLRYKEKRKNRRFEKTIRYASRKAYAETRPRIKGRFARRVESLLAAADTSYGVVPTF